MVVRHELTVLRRCPCIMYSVYLCPCIMYSVYLLQKKLICVLRDPYGAEILKLVLGHVR